MDDLQKNPWLDKSAEDVLAESYNEIRSYIYNLNGFLNVLNLSDMSDEQYNEILSSALYNSLAAKEVVDSVYVYMNEKWGKQ